MTTIETHAHGGDVAADRPAPSTAEAFFSGVGAWAITTDHKRIGRIYLGFGLLGLLGTTVLGALLGAERMGSGSLIDGNALLQIFQAQRVGLVFAALIPIALGLAIAVTPLQLGARQIAFPRVALTGCYAWIGGLALSFAALGRNGGFGGGDTNAVDLFLAGHALMLLGLSASAGCVATSVLTTRAPGMTMRRVPLFAWSTLIASLGMLMALPVAFGAIVYLFVDHRIGIDANFGGVDQMSAWIGWLFSVPTVIVFALPAVGVAAELMPVTFKHRQELRGVTFAGMALIGVTALAAVTQQADGHQISLDSNQTLSQFIDGALPFLVFAALPVLGLVIVLGLGALTAKGGVSGGRPQITAAFVFGFLGLLMIALGLVANLLLNVADLELYGTSFEEGATLLVAYGAAMGVMGGVCFWAPKLWGRVLPDKLVLPLVLPALGGALLAGVPLCIAGLLDQIGGIPSNDAQVAAMLDTEYHETAELWNALSMVGSGLMALAVVAFVLLMAKTFTGAGETADPNPFGGHTVEWGSSSPAPADNYEWVPTVASASPRFDLTLEGSRS